MAEEMAAIDVEYVINGALDDADVSDLELARRLRMPHLAACALTNSEGNITIKQLARVAYHLGKKLVVRFEARQ